MEMISKLSEQFIPKDIPIKEPEKPLKNKEVMTDNPESSRAAAARKRDEVISVTKKLSVKEKVKEVIDLRARIMEKRKEVQLPTVSQVHTYAESIKQDKKGSIAHIAKIYLDNLWKIMKYLNENPLSDDFDGEHGFCTQRNNRYNKLIALLGTGPKLIKSCYSYGMLSTVYTQTGEELVEIPELYKIWLNYKRITKADLYYVRFYSAPAEISEEGIKPVITVVKIGMTKTINYPKESEEQPEIKKEELIEFIREKRVIQLSQIIKEMINTYNNRNPIWISLNRDHELVYTYAKDIRENDFEEVSKWILTLLKPEARPKTRSIRERFVSKESLPLYCKIIGKDHGEHYCSLCGGGNMKIPVIEIEDSTEPMEDNEEEEGDTEEVIMKG